MGTPSFTIRLGMRVAMAMYVVIYVTMNVLVDFFDIALSIRSAGMALIPLALWLIALVMYVKPRKAERYSNVFLICGITPPYLRSNWRTVMSKVTRSSIIR